jgi:nucleoside-diphosphate-sugar epimerase
VDTAAGDIADPAAASSAISGHPDVIFHLAAVVSGEAELDFEKGMHVNFDGSRTLLEAVRTAGNDYRPRFIFASSIAVFGAPFPALIPDEFALTPLTSYGTQKAMIELLLADYSRRGFVDGVGIRLPNIVVRPGKPNKAASGFFPQSSASRSTARKLYCRSMTTCAIGTRAHAPRWGFSFMRRYLTVKIWGRASISPCPAYAAPSPNKSHRCGGSRATRSPRASGTSPIRW